MSDNPYTMLCEEGGIINGKHFDSFADIFTSMGCIIIDGDGFIQGGGYTNPMDDRPYQNNLTPTQKKKRKASNKAERQRRKRGRK